MTFEGLRASAATVCHRLGRRWLNLSGMAACAGLIVFAWYLQFGLGLEPCPLCLLQRWVFWVLAVVFLLAAILPSSAPVRFVAAGLLALVSAAGAALAARHVWLQNLPPERVPECGPDLYFMMERFPLGEALALALRGTGDCAVIDWSFAGLSIPAWALVWFVLLGLYGVIVNLVRLP